jgi:hypothetical protein
VHRRAVFIYDGARQLPAAVLVVRRRYLTVAPRSMPAATLR